MMSINDLRDRLVCTYLKLMLDYFCNTLNANNLEHLIFLDQNR